jgi:hypothetical protein
MLKILEQIIETFFSTLDAIEVWLKLKLGVVLGFLLAKIIKLYAYVFFGAGVAYLVAQIARLILEPFVN